MRSMCSWRLLHFAGGGCWFDVAWSIFLRKWNVAEKVLATPQVCASFLQYNHAGAPAPAANAPAAPSFFRLLPTFVHRAGIALASASCASEKWRSFGVLSLAPRYGPSNVAMF